MKKTCKNCGYGKQRTGLICQDCCNGDNWIPDTLSGKFCTVDDTPIASETPCVVEDRVFTDKDCEVLQELLKEGKNYLVCPYLKEPNPAPTQLLLFPEQSEVFKKLYAEAEKNPEYHAAAFKIEIAEMLYTQMKKRGLNKSQLAKKLKVSRQYVHRIMKGEENLSMLTLAKIANALNLVATLNFLQKEDVR